MNKIIILIIPLLLIGCNKTTFSRSTNNSSANQRKEKYSASSEENQQSLNKKQDIEFAIDSSTNDQSETSAITEERVRFREKPNLQSNVIRFFSKNEVIKILEKSPEREHIDWANSHWYKVEDMSGKIGWVYGAFLDINIMEMPYIEIPKESLTDRTSPENLLDPQDYNYGDGNGSVISEELEDNIETITRVLILELNINEYHYINDNSILYEDIKTKTIAHYFSAEDNFFKSSELKVIKNNTNKKKEAYLKVITPTNKNGWLYLFDKDPYEGNKFSICGSINNGSEIIEFKKYQDSFTCNRETVFYDKPSFINAIPLFTAEYKDESWQINLRSIYISKNKYSDGEYTDYWLKLVDNYGRIGWVFGRNIETSRGGFKYRCFPEQSIIDLFFQM